MATKRVTADDIKQFNELYYELHTFAAVARKTGFSASTVSKYVDKNYTPASQREIKRFDRSMLSQEFDSDLFLGVENFGELCVFSDEEKEEIRELWKELDI